MKRFLRSLENATSGLLLLALALLPLYSILARELSIGSGAATIPLVQHLTLLLAFLGASLAAREDKLLRLATGELKASFKGEAATKLFATSVSVFVSGILARAAADLVLLERDWETDIAGLIPRWILLAVMPLALAAIGLRLSFNARGGWWGIGASLIVFGIGVWLGADGKELLFEELPGWPFVVTLVIAALFGAPLFLVLGGCAALLFMVDGVSALAVPVAMDQLASSPFLPAIPLFTLVGFLLTEGGAPQRMLDVFRTLFGWLPGGSAVICALVCAFFSIFTGGSGVTILALGGLLFHALNSDGYKENFSLGLLTASGSLGILLPPALPLILFGIAAEVPIEDLFIGGILPGILLVSLVAGWGMLAGVRSRVARTPFDAKAALRAIWKAKFELLVPVITLGVFLSGLSTLLEAAALTATYTLIIQVAVNRDVSLIKDLPRVLEKCATLLGGVLIILCAAFGLSSYFVDAEIPMRLLEWIQANIESPLVFLLCVNLFLLVVGCFLDIYSATFVVVPLLLPLGLAYDIHPVHLGIIFVANLELGYLTPPVGLNLFLASYRFERPLLSVYRAAVPMLIILGVGVLLITYLPALTLVFLE